jgi:hypothetical protein
MSTVSPETDDSPKGCRFELGEKFQWPGLAVLTQSELAPWRAGGWHRLGQVVPDSNRFFPIFRVFDFPSSLNP